MAEKNTALKQAIEVLEMERIPLALHQFGLRGASESALGARLREATRFGVLLCRFRKGERFKEWTMSAWGWPVEAASDAKETASV